MNITEFKEKYPVYAHVENEQLARALHAKNYAHVPYEQFAEAFLIQEKDSAPSETSMDKLESGLKRFAQTPGALFETAATIGTSALTEAPAGIAGIIQSLNPFAQEGAGGQEVRAIQEGMTLQPASELTKEFLTNVSNFVQPVTDVIDAAETGAGDIGYEQGGAIGGAIGTALPTFALEAVGLGALRKFRGAKRITGITDNIAESLKRSGVDIDDLTDTGIQKIQQQSAKEIDSIIKRAQHFEAQGVGATRAELTRSPQAFQMQQDLLRAGEYPTLQGFMEIREGKLSNRFDEAVKSTGGSAVQPTSTITEAITNRTASLDVEIGSLYKTAKERSKNAANVDLTNTANAVKLIKGKERVSGGLHSSVKQDLINGGIIDNKFNVLSTATVQQAEDIRKGINSIYNSVTPEGRALSRTIKDSIDDAVTKSAGEDIFKQARAAKTNYEKELSRAKLNKFDARKTNIVRDILDGTVDPETMVNSVVLAKKYRATDLQSLKQYLNNFKGDHADIGTKAWNDLRAETLADIKQKAFKLTESKQEGILSRDGLDKALARIGRDKLRVLFTIKEREFLKDMQKIAGLKEAPPGKALGSGPSAPAIQALTKKVEGNSFFAAVFSGLKTNKEGKLSLKTDNLKPRILIKDPIDISDIQTGTIVAIPQIREDKQ